MSEFEYLINYVKIENLPFDIFVKREGYWNKI
jgi:hypothetical protein